MESLTAAARAMLGNAELRVDGERATLALPDWGLRSYETWIALKSALPRLAVDARARTLGCPTADLVRLGIPVAAALGAYAPDPVLFADQAYVVATALLRRRFAIYAECGW